MPDVTANPFPPKGPPLLSRREFIATTVKLAVAGAIIPGALSQLLPAVAPKALGGGGGAQPVIRRDAVTKAKIPITVADLKPQPENMPLTAEWNYLPAVVYLVKSAVLRASSQVRGYNTGQHAQPHPEDSDFAIMVYEGKCKHLGCTVGWNSAFGSSKDVEDYDKDGLNEGRILCPCHQGQYDIYDLALNQPATPPPAPLNVVRFTIGTWTDPLGKSYTNVLLGHTKIVQAKYKEADLDGQAGKTVFQIASQTPTEAA